MQALRSLRLFLRMMNLARLHCLISLANVLQVRCHQVQMLRDNNFDMNDFFAAPWKIYSDQPNIDLSFYVSQRALKVYTLYKQRKATTKPDAEEQLYDMKRSMQYILKFCNKNKIGIDQYIEHKTNNIYTFVDHLRQHQVNIYVLFGFENFESNLRKCDWEHVKFMLGDMVDHLDNFRTNYLTSSRAKNFVQLGINKIKQIQNKTNTK